MPNKSNTISLEELKVNTPTTAIYSPYDNNYKTVEKSFIYSIDEVLELSPLTGKQKIVIYLRFKESMGFLEIAREINTSKSSVFTAYNFGLRKIKKTLFEMEKSGVKLFS